MDLVNDPQETPNQTLEQAMAEMMREIQRLHRRFDQQEYRPRCSTPSRHYSDYGRDDTPSSDEERPHQRFGVGYDRRPPPLTTTYNNYGVKVELPQFEGSMDHDDFLEWIQTIERVFEYQDIPEDRKLKLASIRLTKAASLWWENLKRARLNEGKQKISTWEKMKREMTRKFLPPHYR